MSGKKRPQFATSLEAKRVLHILQEIESSPVYTTTTTYSSNIDKYPDHRMPFCDKHLDYIESHPELNIDHYLANLRLTTKVR